MTSWSNFSNLPQEMWNIREISFTKRGLELRLSFHIVSLTWSCKNLLHFLWNQHLLAIQIADLLYLMLKVHPQYFEQQCSLSVHSVSNELIIKLTVEQMCKCRWLKFHGVDGEKVWMHWYFYVVFCDGHQILGHFLQMKNFYYCFTPYFQWMMRNKNKINIFLVFSGCPTILSNPKFGVMDRKLE